MGLRSFNRGSWTPQPRSFILLLALLAIIVLSTGEVIVTGSVNTMVDAPTTSHVHRSPRIESPTPALSLIKTTTSVGCTQVSIVVNDTTTCTATVTDSTAAGTGVTPVGQVSFSQTGVSGSFAPRSCSLTGSTMATCSVSFTSTSTGTASITGTYEGDSLHSGSTSAIFSVTIRGFAISTGSATLTLFEGKPASIAITVYSINEFTGIVELLASCTSHDVKVALTGTNITLEQGQPQQSLTLTALAPSYASPGNYTITVIGTYASLTVRSSLVAVVLSVPRLSAPSFVTATPGSLLTFEVNATDSDKTRILLLTADPSSLPNGAYFTSVTGNGTLTGIFDWALSQKTRPGNYTMIFRVSDDRGGTSTAQVVVDVLSVNRSSTLPLTSSLRYVAIAALGVAVIVVGDRLWRVRRARPASTQTPAGSDSDSR